MTPFEQSVRLVHIVVSALVLWFVSTGPWRWSCQERYRQKLFSVRDELFDLARNGTVAFTDPAYVALRAYINSMIRFSHLIGVTRLATFILFKRYIGFRPADPSLGSILAQVKGRDAKEKLTDIKEQVMSHTVRFLLFSSPHLVLASPFLMLLDKLIKPKTSQKGAPAGKPPLMVISIIEVQAREAFRSEAAKRKHASELAIVG